MERNVTLLAPFVIKPHCSSKNAQRYRGKSYISNQDRWINLVAVLHQGCETDNTDGTDKSSGDKGQTHSQGEADA